MKSSHRRRLTGSALALLTAAAVATVASTPASAAPAEGRMLGAGAANAIPSSYIVVFDDTAVARSHVDATARDLAGAHGGRLGHLYHNALRGMEVRLTADQARQLAADPQVKYVEQNATVSVTGSQATPPSWGLDVVDQRQLPPNNTYNYPNTASNVRIYVLDTGIRITHTDFGGRASWGTNLTGDGINTDCNGHGTHVAGTAAGATYGVAKGARLTAVKVLGCDGHGDIASVIAGVDWVTGDHQAGQPAVANMSLGDWNSSAENAAIAASIADGVTYTVAAGNGNQNACLFSPASAPDAITVGAVTLDYSTFPGNFVASTYSNWGPCVDLFAPGDAITSAGNRSDTDTQVMYGTSMASPHVAGAAALILSIHPSYTAQQVRDTLVSDATTANVLTPGSTPRMLYVAAEVPDVLGQTSTAAADALAAVGFAVVIRSVADPRCEHIGQVASQSPTGGTRTAYGSTVTITVGTKPSKPCP